MKRKYLNFLALGIGLLLILLLVVNRGWFSGIQRNLQNVFYDNDQASSEIIVVAIDEVSLAEGALGNLATWPRENYAKAIEILDEQGAAVIGVDITFPNSSSQGKADDKKLADALEKYDNVVMATHYLPQNNKIQFEWPNSNIISQIKHFGFINVMLDKDGFVRQIPVFMESNRGVVDAFSLAVSRIYLNALPSSYYISGGTFDFSKGISIPVETQKDESSREEVNLMYLNYFAAPNSFQRISFVDLLNGEFVDKRKSEETRELIDLKDKIVLIGPTAIDLQDNYLSPVSDGTQMPGVEIHANAIQTVITGEFLKDQSRLSFWLTISLILLVNLVIFSFLKVRYALIIALLEMVGMIIAGILAYEFRIIMNVVYPILAILLSFIGSYLLRFFMEQKERKFIETAFSHYVTKDVVKQIQNDPSMLKLGGAKVDLTVMFSDIAGFTTISEGFKPEKLVSFLNEYLGEMTDIIMKHQGTLDKYEGDAIMAFWNAPLPQHEPALNACLAALENQKRLTELRQKWAQEGMPEMHVRIGINTGEAVVGNMGSTNRFNYTAVGDNVNLASRLEGINKQYGTYLMISGQTYEEVKEHFVCRELDDIRVKGKKKAVKIYELICQKSEETPELKKKLETFAVALELYRHQKFAEAKTKFETLKGDPPAQIFVERCNTFIKNPPKPDWDGVWNFEVK